MAEPGAQQKAGEAPAEQPDVVRSGAVSVLTVSGGRLFQAQQSVYAAQLVLTAEELKCYRQAESAAPRLRRFLLEDLVGINVLQVLSNSSKSKAACQMDVHVYPLAKKSAKKNTRRMEVLSVCFDDGETFQENREQALEWKKAIKFRSRRRILQVFQCCEDVEVTEESVMSPRHFLVLINPVGGQGNAVSDFRQHVEPLFLLAEINCNVVITKKQNHVRDLIQKYDLSTIDGIAIASGDGLLYELVNGMMERDDWEQALKTPIGMLPTGSGNALCASTLYEAGEEFSLVNAAFQIIQGGIIPMDIATVETSDQQTLYMTLLGSWGLVADIDIESEKLRKIGETRFIFGALNCIRKKRIYRGRLVYLPYDGPSDDLTSPLSRSVPSEPTLPPRTAPGAGLVTSSLNPELLAQAMRRERKDTTETLEEGNVLLSSAETDRERSGTQDVFGEGDVLLEESSIGPQMIGTMERMGKIEAEGGGGGKGGKVETGGGEGGKNGVGDKDDGWEVVNAGKEEQSVDAEQKTEPAVIPKPKAESSSVMIEKKVSETPRSYTSSGPTPHLLPELTESAPDNWKVIEGEFLSITPIMISHLSSTFFGDPTMTIGTGKIRILYIRKLSRFAMLGLLSSGEKGTHLERPEVRTIDVRAYRLEPYTEEGLLTVDGEVVKYGPMQAQVHQHLARVFCRKRVSQDVQTS